MRSDQSAFVFPAAACGQHRPHEPRAVRVEFADRISALRAKCYEGSTGIEQVRINTAGSHSQA